MATASRLSFEGLQSEIALMRLYLGFIFVLLAIGPLQQAFAQVRCESLHTESLGPEYLHLHFTQNKKLLIAASKSTLKIIDTQSGRVLGQFYSEKDRTSTMPQVGRGGYMIRLSIDKVLLTSDSRYAVVQRAHQISVIDLVELREVGFVNDRFVAPDPSRLWNRNEMEVEVTSISLSADEKTVEVFRPNSRRRYPLPSLRSRQ